MIKARYIKPKTGLLRSTRPTGAVRGQGDSKPKPAATAPNPFSSYVASVPAVPYVSRAVPQSKQQTGTFSFRFDGCYVCRDFTHLQRECPLIIRTRSNPCSTGVRFDALNFVRDEYFLFDNYEFKSQSLTDCSIKDRLKSNVQFLEKNWCS